MSSAIGSGFRQGLRGHNRPEYKDPWDYFGADAPVWARAAWNGEPYLNTGTGIMVPGAPEGSTKGKHGIIIPQHLLDEEGSLTVPGTIPLSADGHEIAAVGGKGSGKAQPLTEPVLTPSGWVRMMDLSLGDALVSATGERSIVEGIFPQGEQDVFRVDFSDGTYTRATADHLWAVLDGKRKMRGSDPLVMTTSEIASSLTTSQGYSKWYLPQIAPVEPADSNRSDLPIPAYSMGALLGDGCFRGGTPTISSGDPEIVERVASETGMDARFRSGYDYGLCRQGDSGPNALKEAVEIMGLWGAYSQEKHIPSRYLTAPVEDRIELLRGLMDTDGTVTSVGTGSFSTSSLDLANDFLTLVRSLGGVTKIIPKPTTHLMSYRVRVNLPFNPFWIERKASRFNIYATQGRVKAIKSITPDGREHCQCIRVSASDSLYLTRGYTPTHNTYTGGGRAMKLVQRFPGSKGMVVANSYAQAYGSAGFKIVEIANMMGIEFFHRTEMTVDGIKHYNVYVFPAYDVHICILSFDNINLIEGTEWDWAWFEEIQDCPIKGVETAVSRIRRGKADSSVYYAGMPDDVNHDMYAYFEANDIALYEPPLKENEHNLPNNYMKRMRRYHGADYDRYVEGKRISLFRTPALRNFRWDVMVRSDDNPESTSLGYLCDYDGQARIYLTWDFNVNPLCVTAWQQKVVPFEVDARAKAYCPDCREELDFSHLLQGYGCSTHGYVLHPDMSATGRVDKEVLVQIDEWEMFGGATGLMCDHIIEKYSGHHAGWFILGDATGVKSSTNTQEPGRTDWKIIAKKFAKCRNAIVRPGVIRHRKDSKTKRRRGESRVTYTNPPIRDRVTVFNSFLFDDDGHPRIIFLPESELPSGGAAKSCADAKWTGDGKIDSKNDKLDPAERKASRTHFFDGVGYLVYHIAGGKTSDEERGSLTGSIARAKMSRQARYS